MLVTKEQVDTKVATLKEYSISKDALTASLFFPLEVAIESYFSADKGGISLIMEEVVEYMYFDIDRRTTKHEAEFDMKLPSNFPTGYDDVTKCFYQFAGLLSMDNDTFFDAFVYGLPEGAEAASVEGGDGSGKEEIPLSNPYLDEWASEITAAIKGDEANVQALDDWLQNSGGSCDLISLLEEQGKIVERLPLKEKARQIYYDRKVLEVIKTKGLSTYIPSYFR